MRHIIIVSTCLVFSLDNALASEIITLSKKDLFQSRELSLLLVFGLLLPSIICIAILPFILNSTKERFFDD